MISNQSTTRDIANAYAEYGRFLDQELNRAYAQLLTHVSGTARESLIVSQGKWLLYRDSDDSFIESNWTARTFGSSAAISRGEYRTAIVKGRVITLLQYLRNY